MNILPLSLKRSDMARV